MVFPKMAADVNGMNALLAKLKHRVEATPGLYNLVYDDKTIQQDLSQVEMDFENCDLAADFRMPGYSELAPYYEMFDNYPVAWCAAGGDWEQPVAFVIYIGIDDKTHAYIPDQGNQYNREHMCAYGSEPKIDDEDYQNKLEEIEFKWDYELMKKDVRIAMLADKSKK